MRIRTMVAALATAGLASPGLALATDGYFSHGYGMKAKGMGGAATATAQDTFGGAVNPAKTAFVGDRFDIGLDWFNPHRSAERSGGTLLGLNGSADSDSRNFYIPELGFNYLIRPDIALGVTVYGNGGMNTNYVGGQLRSPSGCGPGVPPAGFNPVPGPYNLLCGNGNLGVDLSQLIIAPTAAWQFMPGQSLGIAPLFAYQRFKAEGVQAFAGLSTSPLNVTNNGYDSSTGWGARIGYYGSFMGDKLSVGAAYSTKMSMGNFDKYKGLFAQQGNFDIPENWNVGVAFRPTAAWLLALDYQRINYNKIDAIGNQSNLILGCANGNFSNCLGGSAGAGFGWQNVNVWKLGVQYAVNPEWTVRAGYNHTTNPVTSENVTFNILAPGVVQNHYTVGATWAPDRQNEVTAAFMYAANNTVTGPSLFNPFLLAFGAPPALATMQETIQMKEYSFGLQYSRKF